MWQTPRLSQQIDRSRLGLARQAIMVQDLGQVLADSRAVVTAHNRKHLGEDYNPPEEDDMGIHIGDIVNQPVNQPPVATPRKSGISPLMGGLIGAGLLATGLGAGVGGLLVADAIKNIKPGSTVVAPVTPGDGNTKYQLKLLP